MTEAELKAIKQRAEAVPEQILALSGWPTGLDWLKESVKVSSEFPDVAEAICGFISHARTDIPLLLAEIERLQIKELEAIKAGELLMTHAARSLYVLTLWSATPEEKLEYAAESLKKIANDEPDEPTNKIDFKAAFEDFMKSMGVKKGDY